MIILITTTMTMRIITLRNNTSDDQKMQRRIIRMRIGKMSNLPVWVGVMERSESFITFMI